MHKDQKRVQGAIVPLIMKRVFSDTAEHERDCTVLNRVFLQGPDPLCLMELCPDSFKSLCSYLQLDPVIGRDAIERAHWNGPGVLLANDGGIPTDTFVEDIKAMSQAHKCEGLWLLLASMSNTTEEDYNPVLSMVARLQKVVNACAHFDARVEEYWEFDSPVESAYLALQHFLRDTQFETNENDIPITDQDVGFYIGYKMGYPVVGVKHGDKIFYGANNRTLAECGVAVDVFVSPSYGFVRI